MVGTAVELIVVVLFALTETPVVVAVAVELCVIVIVTL